MDFEERLKMLFAGEDENLLFTNVDLHEDKDTYKPGQVVASFGTVPKGSDAQWSAGTKYIIRTDNGGLEAHYVDWSRKDSSGEPQTAASENADWSKEDGQDEPWTIISEFVDSPKEDGSDEPWTAASKYIITLEDGSPDEYSVDWSKEDSLNNGAFKDEHLASSSRTTKKKAKTSKRKKSKARGKQTTHELATAVASSSGSRETTYFCPLMAISRFPYKYIRGDNMVHIAHTYFDGGKFWDRPWDVYYIHPPAYVSLRPLLLVTKEQAQGLIDTINEDFGCKLYIPSDPEAGVIIPFTPDGTPQPQFIGTSFNRQMKGKLEQAVPSAPSGNNEPGENASPELKHSFDVFREKMETAYAATRRKSKKAKGKRQQTQIQKIRSWNRELKRTQCYLGLRPRAPRSDPDQSDVTIPTDSSWSEQQLAEKKTALANGSILEPLDVDDPAPFTFADEPIFICIDVELNERHHEQITEIGVSTLDTLDLAGVPPGEGGRDWMGKIRCRHFRISEYANVTNHLFVAGCPEQFDFGHSEFVSIANSADTVDSCFQPPYSGHIQYTENSKRFATKEADGKRNWWDDGGVQLPPNNEKTPDHLPEIKKYKNQQRKLVLVGHGLSADVAHLRKLGCTSFDPHVTLSATGEEINHQPYFLDTVDTANLFRILKRETQPAALARVLLELGIAGWNFHNAGNDARYTLEAMVGAAVNAIQNESNASVDATAVQLTPQPGEEGLHWRQEVERRIAVGRQEAEMKVREECAMWDAVMGWNGDSVYCDGGSPHGLNLADL
ncbi:hypothetical protein MaudCBS49596_007677 [Microsporum audouinii]